MNIANFANFTLEGPFLLGTEESNFFPSELEILHQAKPGLTGYWQVMARNNATFDSGERQKLELEYFAKRSFWYDFGLIFRTIPAVLKHRGAK